MEPNKMIVLVCHRSLPDHEDRAKKELARLVATVVRKEPDCVGIKMMQDVDDPTRITLIEQWSSREAYEGPHMQTEHIQSFISRANEFLAGAPDISFWRIQDS